MRVCHCLLSACVSVRLHSDAVDAGYSLESAIQDVLVIAAGKGEQVPEGFSLIDKSLNTRTLGVKMCLAVRKVGPLPSDSFLHSTHTLNHLLTPPPSTKQALPVGLCDLPFQPEVSSPPTPPSPSIPYPFVPLTRRAPQVLDRFPAENYHSFPLPAEMISMFSFPDGTSHHTDPSPVA